MDGTAALSELVESFRGDEEKQIVREEFEKVLSQYVNGPRATQQVAQLWDKLDSEGRGAIGQGAVCSFLLQEMQQRESQARAHTTPPLPHHPHFTSTLHTKETICHLLPLSNPSQYLSVSKDGVLNVWSTRFQLQQARSIRSSKGDGRGKPRGTVWVTSCVMMCGRLVLATTGRELAFYDIVSLDCLHKIYKLPCVPLCITYGSLDESDPAAPGHLVWGDESGSLGILSVSHPNKPLFQTSQSTLVSFNRLSEHAPQVQLRYIAVHSGWVCQVGWTGPGHCIISAAQSPSPSLVIQHVLARRKPYEFQLRMGVSCFSYSQALEVLATGSLDHMVRLWTPFTPQRPVAVLAGHNTAVVGLATAEHSGHLFSLSQDLTLCAWDIHEHHLLQMMSVKFPFTQRLPDFGPSPLTLLPHPSPTLTITCNEYIARYTLSTGQNSDVEGAGLSHGHPVCAVLYSPVLHQVLSGSEGGEVRVWEAASGKCVLRIERCHGQQELTALAVDSEGRRVLTGARDGAIKVWETLTGQCLQTLTTPGRTEVTSIVHQADKRRFLATGWNRRITTFKDQALSLATEPGWVEGTPHNDDIIAMDYCPPHYLATGSFDGNLLVWNTDTERIMSQFRSMLKLRPPLPGQRRSHTVSGSRSAITSHPSHCTSSLHSSRPASRRLSSYRLKSASSTHWHHVPIDQLLFLKSRARTQVRGQATLVSSEGGHARFWDMFISRALGSFPLTPHEEEVVLALATDPSNHWLLAGDTAGYISTFNVARYCTTPGEDALQPQAECMWRAHASEVLDVAWVGQGAAGLLASSSADHTVRLWTTEGHYVGWFGQQQSWDITDYATFQHPNLPFPEPPHHSMSAETKPGRGGGGGGGTDGGKTEQEKQQGARWEELDRASPPQEPLSPELAMLDSKTLGQPYHSGMVRRIAGRQERRGQYSEVDASSISRFPSLFSPFQALRVPAVQEVKVPRDMNSVLATSPAPF